MAPATAINHFEIIEYPVLINNTRLDSESQHLEEFDV